MKAQERFPGYSAILHVLLRADARKAIVLNKMEASCLDPSRTLPSVSFLLADFNMYSFPLISILCM